MGKKHRGGPCRITQGLGVGSKRKLGAVRGRTADAGNRSQGEGDLAGKRAGKCVRGAGKIDIGGGGLPFALGRGAVSFEAGAGNCGREKEFLKKESGKRKKRGELRLERTRTQSRGKRGMRESGEP